MGFRVSKSLCWSPTTIRLLQPNDFVCLVLRFCVQIKFRLFFSARCFALRCVCIIIIYFGIWAFGAIICAQIYRKTLFLFLTLPIHKYTDFHRDRDKCLLYLQIAITELENVSINFLSSSQSSIIYQWNVLYSHIVAAIR